MKGKGKGKCVPQPPGWEMPSPYKAKGKGNLGSRNPGKGAWGKGGKGAYGLEDDWSEGYSGYAYGFEDVTLLSLAKEAMKGMADPKPQEDIQNDQPVSPERGKSRVYLGMLQQNQHRQVRRPDEGHTFT